MVENVSRRQFLRRISIAGGTIALAGSPLIALAHGDEDTHIWRGRRRTVKPGRRFFPQSVASFDPRPDGVLLWARVQDDDHAGQSLPLTLLVATDPWLQRLVVATEVTADADDEGVVQVKLTGLKPRTRYYYRFVYEKGGHWFGTATARTQTAPKPSDAAPVRFVLANCQNAIGSFYNAYLPLLALEVDFVLHLGDYIYETTGDPSFQNPTGRRIEFTDQSGAIELHDAQGNVFHAAASVSNYRELYRFYRADPILQRLHERFAFVCIWDDHEYSNDCWGATATYHDGRKAEFDEQRRRNAERVFYEYIAVDDGTAPAGEQELSARPLYPNGRLYRDLRYGKNLQLLLTDYRSFRPDHLIPEDAFPGTVGVDRAALTALLGAQGIPYDAVKANFAPYVDLDAPPAGLEALFGAYRAVLSGVLTLAYTGEGLPIADAAAKAADTVTGKLDALVVNALLASYNADPSTNPKLPLIGEPLLSALDRGISFAILGKAALFSSTGSRNVVVKPTFDLYAAYKSLLLQNPAAENAYGDDQLGWLQSVLAASDARWKVVANSTSLTSMVLDLTGETPGLPQAIKDALAQLPALLRNRFYLNLDQFDGFPNFRRRLLELYASRDDVALVAGDIHAAFATHHAGGIWEFTAPAVSSFVFRTAVERVAHSDPRLQVPGIDFLVSQLDVLLAAANPEIRYVDTTVNGVVVLEASRTKLAATYYQLPGAEAARSYYERPWQLLGKLTAKRFEVRSDAVAEQAVPLPAEGIA